MKRIDLPTSTVTTGELITHSWDKILSDARYLMLAQHVSGNHPPSDIQTKAISEGHVLISRRSLIISSPTNSGKSLLGYLALLRGLRAGKRVLLLEPLRAVAKEKYEELSKIARALELAGLQGFKVEITTGDYRIDFETLQSPPPMDGQLVIATPERVEAILRNPELDEWIQSISTIVIDEAHLLGDSLRGATLEYVITSFKIQDAHPRLILLSATLGATANLEAWLDPCDVVCSTIRTPELRKTILDLEAEESLNQCLYEEVRSILKDPNAKLLIFVYQTASADKLARDLAGILSIGDSTVEVSSYHAKKSAATRESVRKGFDEGHVSCVVCTTALAMGVNLKATHVIVRDLNRANAGKVSGAEILQMIGRAGRGLTPGHSIIYCPNNSDWDVHSLKELVAREALPEISSSLGENQGKTTDSGFLEIILSLLAKAGEKGLSQSGLHAFFEASLCSTLDPTEICAGLNQLSGSQFLLAHQTDDRWVATTIGKRAITGSLPLEVAGGIGQLIRDLLSIDEKDQILSSMSKLDCLVLVELVASSSRLKMRFGESTADRVDNWMNAAAETSILFKEWIRGKEGYSKADEIIGSLNVPLEDTYQKKRRNPRNYAYMAVFRAIILWQRSHGVRPEDLNRRWRIPDLVECEEKWRDDRLFVISGLINIFDIRCFYYHLRQECEADDERIHRVKRRFQVLQAHCRQLLNLLSWVSPLGPLFVRLRAASGGKNAKPALKTMQKLEAAGYTDITELRKINLDDLKRLGIKSSFALQILNYANRNR